MRSSALGVLLLALAPGCGPSVNTDGEGATGAAGSVGSSGGGGTSGGSGASPACGTREFMLQRRPADLLVVLDKSGSMAEVPPAGGASKWVQVTSAINTAVATASQIQWGLELFPSDNNCGVSSRLDVPVGPSGGARIGQVMAQRSPGGNTPTQTAVRAASWALGGVTDGNAHFIVLATDGQPNCASGGSSGTSDEVGAVQAVADAAAFGIRTFVIGVATDSRSQAVLEAMARSGQTARTSVVPAYYPAGSQAEFEAAIGAIAGQVTSCTYPLDSAPPSPDLVGVSADGRDVPRDRAHGSGWDYGPANQSIVLFGSWCADLQAGAIHDLKVTFGCPPVGLAKP
jgi:hypothetical protein